MVDAWLLISHVVMMLGSLAPTSAALVLSFVYFERETGFRWMVGNVALGAVLLFIGGLPLGWAVAYQKLGVAWGGVPFGWDFTDNKTLVVVLYWAFALLTIRGTFVDVLKRRERASPPDFVSRRTFARLVMYGTYLEAAIFLVPHSIKLPAWATMLAFGVAMIPLALIGVSTARRARTRPDAAPPA